MTASLPCCATACMHACMPATHGGCCNQPQPVDEVLLVQLWSRLDSGRPRQNPSLRGAGRTACPLSSTYADKSSGACAHSRLAHCSCCMVPRRCSAAVSQGIIIIREWRAPAWLAPKGLAFHGIVQLLGGWGERGKVTTPTPNACRVDYYFDLMGREDRGSGQAGTFSGSPVGIPPCAVSKPGCCTCSCLVVWVGMLQLPGRVHPGVREECWGRWSPAGGSPSLGLEQRQAGEGGRCAPCGPCAWGGSY